VVQNGVVFDGPVMCLLVVGNRAVAGTDPEDDPGEALFIVVEDNGTPGETGPDRGTALVTTDRLNPAGCFAVLTGVLDLLPIEGNIVVRDALPN